MLLLMVLFMLQVEATPDPVSTCAVSGTTLPPCVAVCPVPVSVQPAAPDVTVDQYAQGAAGDTSGATQGQHIPPLPCRCLDEVQCSVVSGSSLRTASSLFRVDAHVSCGVDAAARHSSTGVDVCVEGCKLVEWVGRGSVGFSGQQLDVF